METTSRLVVFPCRMSISSLPTCFDNAERLAQMYLMKWRYPNFNSNAGAVWRQLFVLSLLPWMRKHRVFSDVRLSQAIEALALRKLEVEEDEKGVAGRFGEDMRQLQRNVEGAGANVGAEISATAEKTKTATDAGLRFVGDGAGRVVNKWSVALPGKEDEDHPPNDRNEA